MRGKSYLATRRRQRTRARIRQRAGGRPRLTVFRSNKHLYAQVIDDGAGVTVVSASTLEAAWKELGEAGTGLELAAKLGSMVAERALAKGVTTVVFDRGDYRYHGKVKALADGARGAGLVF